MKKTKIVATLGPSTSSIEVLKQLIEAGVNVFRINMSHGDQQQWSEIISRVRHITPEIPIMMDTKGPELRIVNVHGENVLTPGEEFTFSTTHHNELPHLSHDVSATVGQTVLLDDGAITVTIEKIDGKILTTRVEDGGVLTNKRKVTLPSARVDLPVLTEYDMPDIEFCKTAGIDAVAASFAQTGEDIRIVRKALGEGPMIIAKIETITAVNHIDEIIEESDGIMVARGDLGVEIPLEDVPLAQKKIVQACNAAGKPVIVATQCLESMITTSRPTRAEASDVANSVLDGADALMLSGETAIGEFPVDAVKTMAKVAKAVEHAVETPLSRVPGGKLNIAHAISNAVYDLATNLQVDAIITATATGFTARMVSRFRPKATLVGVAHDLHTLRRLQFTWGVYPCLFVQKDVASHHTVSEAVKSALQTGLINEESTVITTAGVDTAEKGSTNLIEVHQVGDLLRSHKSN